MHVWRHLLPDTRMSHLTDPNVAASLVTESHPFAFYKTEGEWVDIVRPAHIVETVEDVIYALAHLDAARPTIACGFCGERYTHEAKTPDRGIAWFRSHACEGEGVDIEQWLAA